VHFINAFWKSFFSRDVYIEAYRSWKGIGFTLIAVLVILQTIAITVHIHSGLGKFIREDAPAIIQQLPEITFSNGLASTPEAKAYKINIDNVTLAIIDTREEHPPKDLAGAKIFFAQKSVTLEKNNFEQRNYTFESLNEFVINQDLAHFWLNLTGQWTALICCPFILGFLLVYRLVQLLFFSLITLIAGAILKVSGAYAATLRLTAVALTPPLLIFSVLSSAIPYDFQGSTLLFVGAVITYIFFGTYTVGKQTLSQ
jgi:Protein of unknown function (DUF1189)